MHTLPTVLIKPRKRWLCHDMTEKKMFTGTLSLNTNKIMHSLHERLFKLDKCNKSYLNSIRHSLYDLIEPVYYLLFLKLLMRYAGAY